MRIIIVGAGISGLSAYLYLRKHLPNAPLDTPDCPQTHEILIYEAHQPRTKTSTLENATFNDLSASTAIVGGGLGLSPNGMRVLRDLSSTVHDAIVAQGWVAKTFFFKSARGHNLICVPTSDGRDPPEYCVASSREGVVRSLREQVPAEALRYARVSEVVVGETKRAIVRFGDGTPEIEADLVLGADGVKSAVRKAVLGEENDRYAPVYEGLAGVGNFLDIPVPPEVIEKKSMVFTHGPNGFFGYSGHGPKNQTMWWSTSFLPEPFQTTAVDINDMRDQLKKRHGKWADPFIREIVGKAEVNYIYPTWTMPTIPVWAKDSVVLIGDAAHALTPTTGQGASQCLEDAQTFALLLAHYLGQCYNEGKSITEHDAVEMSGKALYDIRHERVKTIGDRGRRISNTKKDQNVIAEYGMYLFLWILGTFPSIGKLILGDQNKYLYHWDVREEVRHYVGKRDINQTL